MLSATTKFCNTSYLFAFSINVQKFSSLSCFKHSREKVIVNALCMCNSQIRYLRRKVLLSENFNSRENPSNFGKIVSLNESDVEIEHTEKIQKHSGRERKKIKWKLKDIDQLGKNPDGFSSSKDLTNLGKTVSADESEVEIENTGKIEKKSNKEKSKKNIKFKEIVDNVENTDLRDSDEDEDLICMLDNKSVQKVLNNAQDEVEPEIKHKILNIRDPSKSRKLLCSVMTSLKSRNVRHKKQQIIVEGKRLINEALLAGLEPEIVFFSTLHDLNLLQFPQTVKVYKTLYKDLNSWSDVTTSQGILCVFKMPSQIIPKNVETIPITVICDNIRQPENLGSVLRVAASVGCQHVFLTKGCVDIWEAKTIRSGCGAQFRIPINTNITWDEIEKEIPEDRKIVLADSTSKNVAYESENEQRSNLFKSQSDSSILSIYNYLDEEYKNQHVVVVVGGETKGLSSEAIQFAEKRKGVKVYIPMSNNIESLNVGVTLGILLYEVRRQKKISDS